MTKLYFKNNKVSPPHKIDDLNGWKELEYNIPTYDEETHRVKKYSFEELDNKVIAHAEIIEIEDEEEYYRQELVPETEIE